MATIRLSNVQIPYLTQENIEKYSTLKVFTNKGELVRLNPLVLAACHSAVTNLLDVDMEEDVVITEFTFEELQSLRNYTLTGVKTVEAIDVLNCFGAQEEVVNLTKVKVEMYESEEPMMDEPLEYNYDDEYNSNDEDHTWTPHQYGSSSTKKSLKMKPLIKSEPGVKKPRREDCLTKEMKRKFEEEYQHNTNIETYKTPPQYTSGARTKHQKNIDYSKKVECSQCNGRFSSQKGLEEHVISSHLEHYCCPFCTRPFDIEYPDKFKLHLFKHDQNLIRKKVETCVQCGKVCRSASHLKEHVKTRGPFHDDGCAQCDKKLASYKEYQDHVQHEHYGVWKLKCGFCTMVFDEAAELKSHIGIIHQGKTPPENKNPVKRVKEKEICEECGKHVTSLWSHINAVHKDFQVPCPYCDFRGKNKFNLQSHIKWYHEQIPCEICGEMLGTKKMATHIALKHTSIYDRKFKCEVCGKGFIDNQKLSEHKNVHTGEKPYKCKFCNVGFGSRGTRAMHQRGHLGHKRK